MKYLCIISLFVISLSSCKKNGAEAMTAPSSPFNNRDTSSKYFTYLALGDSYTIGQSVPAQDNFPNQTISLLKKDNLFGQVKIIATTGWKTTNLKQAIEQDTALLPYYDIVSLLIGVNNEYQGAAIENYQPEFDALLQKAIALAGASAKRVIVLSLPDWGVTPFANGRDRAAISKEIDAWNAVNKAVSDKHGVHYIDITPWTREAANNPSLLDPFGLHPSVKNMQDGPLKWKKL